MQADAISNKKLWSGGWSPFNNSYGKVMMWYFLISDTFTFGAFLLGYGANRVLNIERWPKPSEVFDSIPIPGLDHFQNLPLVFVSFMTFTLILSSVTMVRAVQEGVMRNRKGVMFWMVPTILGGLTFLGCQYFEWSHLIHEGMTLTHTPFSATGQGAGPAQFGTFFYLITGFHGLHVTGGVIFNIWLLYKTWTGHFDRLGHYEMVEKLGLYWHFVDLVWVYVFLCYYLI